MPTACALALYGEFLVLVCILALGVGGGGGGGMISYWPVMEAMLRTDCATKENDPVNVHLQEEDGGWQYTEEGYSRWAGL